MTATLMTIRLVSAATATESATLRVTAADAPIFSAGMAAGDVEVAADAYLALDDAPPSIWPAPSLIMHLHQVWGMDLAVAIHAVSAAVTDGEHMVLHTDWDVAGHG